MSRLSPVVFKTTHSHINRDVTDYRAYVYKDIVLEAEQTFNNIRSALSFVAGRLEAYGYKDE